MVLFVLFLAKASAPVSTGWSQFLLVAWLFHPYQYLGSWFWWGFKARSLNCGCISVRVRGWYLNTPRVLVFWRWEGEFISVVKQWWGISAVYDGTCLWSNLSISWNLPLILAPVWRGTPACLSLILTHAPVWKTCQILEKRGNKLQSNFWAMLRT